jgi:hypothetical protein
MEIDFKNVVNGIVGVVCRFILSLKLVKKIVVDFTRMDFFQKGSIFKWYWLKNLCYFHRGHRKLKQQIA